MKESKYLEFKENITNTFLKTVSAFANYGTGSIVFGVSDSGCLTGISELEKTCLDIENKINDSIDPVPRYILEIDEKDRIIRLMVYEGLNKPYLYKAKAYRRNDTATIEADRLELTRLILEGQNRSFEQLESKTDNLEFYVLGERLLQKLQLSDVNDDVLKTLELFVPGKGINKAGELMADKNDFCGVDIVRFGRNINTIMDRDTFSKESLILQYERTLDVYRKYYQYEEIKGSLRETISLIPEEAMREAIANALIHRAWDIDAHITVAMYDDRIEITSPGGLPSGLNKEDYLRGGISLPRNRIIATVFLRLGLIERFGTGIRRINEAYATSDRKPIFEVSENRIIVTLPVMSIRNGLSDEESVVYNLVKGRRVASSSIVAATGFGKTKVVSILNRLVAGGYVHTMGNGRGLKYSG